MGFRKGYDSAFFFALSADSMSDPIKFPTRGPKMCWVFKVSIAKSTLTRVFINFSTMSPEPSMSRKELDEFAQGRATKFHNNSPSLRRREPLLSLVSKLQLSIGHRMIGSTVGPFIMPLTISATL